MKYAVHLDPSHCLL